MTQRSADERAIDSHFRNTAGEISPVLGNILRNPRGEKLLQSSKRAGGEHFGAERVLLQLLEVGLRSDSISYCCTAPAITASLTAR